MAENKEPLIGEIIELEDLLTGSVLKAISDDEYFYFSSENNGNSILSKYSFTGDLEWQKSFNYDFHDGLNSVEITEDNNILFSTSSLDGRSYLKKIDQNGNEIWSIDTYAAVGDIEEKDNIIYISGGTGIINSFNSLKIGFISAYDSNNGTQLWTKEYQNSGAAFFGDIEITD